MIVRTLLLFAWLAAALPAAAAVMDFRGGDFAYTDSERPPASGWQPGALPAVSIKYQNVARGIDPPTVRVRVRFTGRNSAAARSRCSATGCGRATGSI